VNFGIAGHCLAVIGIPPAGIKCNDHAAAYKLVTRYLGVSGKVGQMAGTHHCKMGRQMLYNGPCR
jgi:hypothetical protein